MAEYKEDIKIKLRNEKTNLVSRLPSWMENYFEIELVKKSQELRTHIAAAKDIITFLTFYSSTLEKDKKDIAISDLNKVTPKTITEYMKYLESYTSEYIDKRGNKVQRIRTNGSASIARKIATLKGLFKYLYNNNMIEHDPVDGIKIKRAIKTKINNRLEKADIYDLEKTIGSGNYDMSNRERIAHEKLWLRDITILIILSYTGIRVSELVSLDIDNINLRKCTITVTRKNNKVQEIPFPADATDILEEYMKYRKNLKGSSSSKRALFLSQKNNRISDQTVRALLKKYASKISLENVSCHTFRRTFLSTLYNKTGDIRLVAKVGGHSVATASKYYADVDDDRYREELRNFKY